MDAVLATIVAGGQAPIQLNIEVNKIISYLHQFSESGKILQQRPWTIYAQGRLPLRRRGFIESTLLEGQAAPLPWW
jgi:hypothetical protein